MIAEFGRRFVKEGVISPGRGTIFARLENLRNFSVYTLETTPVDKALAAIDQAEYFVNEIEC